MIKYLITLAVMGLTLTAFGQATATTDDGRKVILNANGTWKFIKNAFQQDAASVEVDSKAAGMEELAEIVRDSEGPVANSIEEADSEPIYPTSSVFIGGRRLISGERTVINSEDDDFVTSITLAKDGERTLIIFWQDTNNEKINFFNWNWTGTVLLYLENGESISLTDRNMHGQNKIPNGLNTSYGIKTDLYQRYSAHYLTLSECQKLKRSDITQVAYKTTEAEQSTIYLKVTDNPNTLRDQVKAIGR